MITALCAESPIQKERILDYCSSIEPTDMIWARIGSNGSCL